MSRRLSVRAHLRSAWFVALVLLVPLLIAACGHGSGGGGIPGY
jgi:hypothetical protein